MLDRSVVDRFGFSGMSSRFVDASVDSMSGPERRQRRKVLEILAGLGEPPRPRAVAGRQPTVLAPVRVHEILPADRESKTARAERVDGNLDGPLRGPDEHLHYLETDYRDSPGRSARVELNLAFRYRLHCAAEDRID